MKKLISVALAIAALVLPIATPAQAAWQMNQPVAGMSSFVFRDIESGQLNYSQIWGRDDVAGKQLYCSAVDDPRCKSLKALMLNFIVPPCTANSTPSDMCIKEFDLGDSSGNLKKAIFDHEIDMPKIAANAKAQTPQGGAISVWKDDAGNLYGVQISIRYNIDYNPATRDPGVAYVFSFNASVIPVKYVSGNYVPYRVRTLPSGDDFFESFSTDGSPIERGFDCAWIELGKCAMRSEFTKNQKIGLTMQMDNRITGWLFGRVGDASVSVEPLTSEINSIRIEGNSIQVPISYAEIKTSEIAADKALSAAFMNCGGRDCPVERPQGDRLNWQYLYTQNPEDPNFNVGYVDALAKYLKAAPVENSRWDITGMTPGNWRVARWPACFDAKNGLIGIISTNASIYDPSPPELVDGFMTYKVAGPHNGFDNAEFKGSYELNMKSDTARCLYGFSKAPVSATISITSGDGSVQNVATTLLSEKNGWMKLSAKNFTFSVPTIRIKLTQEAVKAPSEPAAEKPAGEAKAATKAIAPKSIAIKCKKGSVTKKIVGAKPVCPKGYKKV